MFLSSNAIHGCIFNLKNSEVVIKSEFCSFGKDSLIYSLEKNIFKNANVKIDAIKMLLFAASFRNSMSTRS